MNNKTWIIGCGDIGQRVAQLYESSPNNANQIIGIVQSKESIKQCAKENIHAIQLNLDTLQKTDQHSILKKITESRLFYFAPPPLTGEKDTRLKKLLAHLSYSKIFPKRMILISTTGVYGDSKGKWIDETTPVQAVADRAKRRLDAEKTLTNWSKDNNVETVILRVSGIYAIDRLPLARLKKGLPIVNESEAGYTNRIHADDLAIVCKIAMESIINNEIINVCDGNPSTMTDYFNHVADFSGLPRPPQISMKEAEATLSAGMVSYLKESRRIKNEKLMKLLKIKLNYPNLSSTLPLDH